jgi:hypothetical protein
VQYHLRHTSNPLVIFLGADLPPYSWADQSIHIFTEHSVCARNCAGPVMEPSFPSQMPYLLLVSQLLSSFRLLCP